MSAELPIVLFTGSRGWPHYLQVVEAATQLHDLIGPYTVMHGAARGLDTFAGVVARTLDLPEDPNPADWKRYGQYEAGKIRNTAMLKKKPMIVMAFWHGQSRGTLDCLAKAVNVYRIPTVIYRSY